MSHHRFFASVRARRCSSSCSNPVRGGVVELQLDGSWSHSPSWRVVVNESGLGNAAMYDEDGNIFSDECMPIDVTTEYGDQAGHRLVVADPSADAILMHDTARLLRLADECRRNGANLTFAELIEAPTLIILPCREATTPRSAKAATISQAVSANASRSRAPSSRTRPLFFSTRRPLP